MSEEIFVNIETEIQQPYNARVPVNGQEPNIRQTQSIYTAESRQPSTYQYRSPFIYNTPVSGQEPNIRNAQQPFTYTRQGQTPTIYQHQSPFTYARQGLQPATYNFQNPYPYIAAGQQPNGRALQSPYPYIANARQPGFYQHPSPFTYQNPVNAQEPNIRDTQQPYPYIAAGQESNQVNAQEPNIRNSQTPFTYNYRSPFTYRNPVSAQEPNIRNQQEPNIRNQQEPNIRSSQTAFTYQHRSPFTYRNPVSAQQPTIKNAQEPNIRNQQEPNIRNAQAAFTYNYRSPFTYQNPVNKQNPYPYSANSQTPFTYQHQSPFTYARQGQTPTTYNVQTPATTSSSTPIIAQQPAIYDGVDGEDAPNNAGNTTWGPGNSAAIHINAGQSQSGLTTTNRTWETTRSHSSAYATSGSCLMRFDWQESGTNAYSVKAKWYAVDSAAMGPVYEDYINFYGDFQGSSQDGDGIEISAKWNSNADIDDSNFGGSAEFPNDSANETGAKVKNQYYMIWDGEQSSDSATAVGFKWSASSGSSNQGSLGYLRSTGVSIQLKVVNGNVGSNPTIYTTNPTSQLIQLSMSKGGGDLQ